MTDQYQSSSPQVCTNTIKSKHPLEILSVDVPNMQYLMDNSNKMSISNINKHHQNTIDS